MTRESQFAKLGIPQANLWLTWWGHSAARLASLRLCEP